MDPMTFHALADWEAWLADHHETAGEAWLAIAKKGAPTPTITAAEAGDVAICFGWIDSRLDKTSRYAVILKLTSAPSAAARTRRLAALTDLLASGAPIPPPQVG
jgi:uncharacterized protein YdeI (YjbR/CyaY-like superfamily)